jgi:signal transduction histidine kinase
MSVSYLVVRKRLENRKSSQQNQLPSQDLLTDPFCLYQQVMWNLVKNAVKFSTSGGSISITSANEADGGLTLRFIYHGTGIEPALLPLIFNPFRQGNHVEAHPSGGLGLGLFLAKE